MISLSQPALIETIIKDTIKPMPAKSSKIMHYFTESPDFYGHFHYWSVIGQLNYLAQLRRPEIQFAIHSCARFSTCDKHEHEEALEYIARYLKGNADLVITLHPKQDQGFKVYADADFAGNWLKEYAKFDPTTASQDHVVLLLMPIVQFFGLPSCNRRLH